MRWQSRIAALFGFAICCIVYLFSSGKDGRAHDNNISVEVTDRNLKSASNSSNLSNCDSNPCQNRGRCRFGKGRYVCDCEDGWIGGNCDEKMDEKHKRREELWAEILDSRKTKRLEFKYPDVIGIGVEKCGTDAVISFLRHHPLVKTPPKYPETQFFNEKYGRGMMFYRYMMPQAADDEIVMEKTPAYFNFPPIDVPDRIKKALPNVKLILVLCDPVNRTYSDFAQEKIIGGIYGKSKYDPLVKEYLRKYGNNLTGLLNMPDNEAYDLIHNIHKNDKPSHIFTTGLYYYALQRWTDLFDLKQLYIIAGEELMSQPGVEVEKLQDFLGLPKLLLKEDFIRNKESGFFCFNPKWSTEAKVFTKMYHYERCLGKQKGRTRNKTKNATIETIETLQNFYGPFNEKLYTFLKRRMKWQ